MSRLFKIIALFWQNIVSFIGLFCKRVDVRVCLLFELVSSEDGVATISRLFKIIGLFWQNIVSFIGLFCKRDRAIQSIHH